MDDLGATFGLSPGIFGAFLGFAIIGALVFLIVLMPGEQANPATVMSMVTAGIAFSVMLGLWPIWSALLVVMGFALTIVFWGRGN